MKFSRFPIKLFLLSLVVPLLLSVSLVDARAQTVSSVTQWSVNDLTFSTSQSYDWENFPLQVTFEHIKTGFQLELDAFWNGGKTWGVRFSPALSGTWKWKASSASFTLSDGLASEFVVTPPTQSNIAANPNFRGHIQVSADNRHFTYADGTPFFFLADTSWYFNTDRSGIERNTSHGNPFTEWLNDRVGKGFTVAQVRMIKDNYANEGGEAYTNAGNKVGTLNVNYWPPLDERMQRVWDAGMTVSSYATWARNSNIQNWNFADLKLYTRYMLARYGAYNIFWTLTGEYDHNIKSDGSGWTLEQFKKLGNYAASHNAYGHPISIHPALRKKFPDQRSSSAEFNNQSWLDFNQLQTGHDVDWLHDNATMVAGDYNRTPTRPVVHAEGWYENLNNFNGGDPPAICTPYQARWQGWVAYTNGAAGHAYGADGIANFYDPNFGEFPPYGIGTSWWEGLDLAGSTGLKHLSTFFTSMDFWKLEPHREWLRINGSAPPMPSPTDITPPHMAAIPGQAYIVYVPEGNNAEQIKITNLQSKSYIARWFNPRTGSYSSINSGNPVNTDGNSSWLAPGVPNNKDWVLYLTDSAPSQTPTFADVPVDHLYYDEIETLYQAGYTAGCQADPLLFCPEAAMNRAESAVFVERGIHGTGVIPTDPNSQIFADLSLDSWAAKWATGLYDDGFTAGCGEAPLVYCPWQGHTRTEGTVFYLRMLNGADYLPPNPVGLFTDVALDFWGTDWIEAAYNAGLIPACSENPLRFCPGEPLTRAVAAYMMVQAKGLALP